MALPKIVLTATVAPAPNVSGLKVRDPSVRLRQYKAAFSELASSSNLTSGIVVAENSDFDANEFAPLFSSFACPVELVNATQFSNIAAGRGRAELDLIDQALRKSDLLCEVTDRDQIWKVTGRYKVLNFHQILRNSMVHFDLMMNYRRYPKPWVDMWVFGFTIAGWRALYTQEHLLDERKSTGNVPAEISMVPVLEMLSRDPSIEVFRRLPSEPKISGVRAWDGRRYESRQQRLKYLARVTSRRLAPKLYI